ncbi:alpha-amylase family glycosyl hydrolase [Cellulomonas hominis]|uniref:alpha-amylase family glycosyl hydrolase n=1 Tax=Cellulomonas hominis TaxID=156981 RepID=UPI001B9395B6|nr:alpha-amylase family glycosyl hydrolase [Cellulomonas hominis]VTR76588.1 Sucrose phosphorylase [Cellulomonas hominis]
MTAVWPRRAPGAPGVDRPAFDRPAFDRPAFERPALDEALRPLLDPLYGDDAPRVRADLLDLAERWSERLPHREARLPDQSTAYLITYADAVQRAGEPPLQTLRHVLDEHVGSAITDVHLLPVYPWTSDDGFAVVDHRQIDPALGTWRDVEALAGDRRVMLDLVANHMSASSPSFTGWLAGDPELAGYFIERDPAFDDARVVRPRTSPLHHRYRRGDGPGEVEAWTTFGPDQVDVDVREPRVLLDLTDVLLGYVAHGARTIRLDAIGFLWKESGTTCLHLPQTHAVIKAWRAVLDHVAPGTLVLTETNVPHAENVSYFGDGGDEAHLVYQFALPPLVLDAFVQGRADVLGAWAAGVGAVSGTATWFTFLASHDGIGMRPSEGLLDDAARDALARRALAHGGRVSMATDPAGRERMYELNVGFLDALADPGAADHDAQVVTRGLAAHSILLSLAGVPAVYYHSLLGSPQDVAGMTASGIARRVNRARLDADELDAELRRPGRRREVFTGLRHMLTVRAGQSGFDPFAPQDVSVVAGRALVVRRAAGTPEEVVAVTNVSGAPVTLDGFSGTDVLTGTAHVDPVLPPYGYVWLRP